MRLQRNKLTTLPAAIRELRAVGINENKLTCLPAAIDELIAARCHVYMDDGL